MTKVALLNLINTLINDNTAKEVSAKDVRDALEAVYDASVVYPEFGGREYLKDNMYLIGDVITYDGLLYICKVAHNASVWAVDKNNWSDTISDAGLY